MNKSVKRAWLILADGTVYEGKSFGAEGTVFGELVCTTGMTGFQENLTDQSYYGQIIAQTFPLMGNYGINSYNQETCKVWANGYVVREYCENPSNFRSEMGLNEFLVKQNTVGIYGVDTRALTRKLRTYGVMNCSITTAFPENFDAAIKEIRDYKIKTIITKNSCPLPEYFNCPNEEHTVVLYDYGVKDDIVKSMLTRNCKVISVPPDTLYEDAIKYNPDGFILADGAGDPMEYSDFFEYIKALMANELPVFGIGLGHELMALVNGAKIEKMHYGHRGANQPVLDVNKNKVFISTQNHGYVVNSDTLDASVGYVSHKNVNDNSCEGIRYTNSNALSLTYNPEPSSGPLDTKYIYDEFIEMMK